jgi:Leucine-rich repeat (LRR) protein
VGIPEEVLSATFCYYYDDCYCYCCYYSYVYACSDLKCLLAIPTPIPGTGTSTGTEWLNTQVGIPEEVLDVTSLTKLVLTSNRIKEISLRLCEMQQLSDLWLSRNLIR